MILVQKYLMSTKKIVLLSFNLLWGVCVFSRVTLPGIYTSHMVLQQQSQVTLRGQAHPNKTVYLTASWCDTVTRAKSDANGRFVMHFATPTAGGPYTMRFSDGQVLNLKDVYIGEVWLGSGQSNMEMPVAGWGKIKNYEQEIANANYPLIRLYQVKRKIATQPINEVSSTLNGWQPCSSKSVPEFSALCYCFARELYNHLTVPIGIINSSWGGTPGETWMSSEAVGQVQGFVQEMASVKALGYDATAMYQRYEELYQQWFDSVMTIDAGKEGWQQTNINDSAWNEMHVPGYFDLEALPHFDGVVWYRLHINLPLSWDNQPLTLHLGCIDDEDRTFVNGRFLEASSGWDYSRTYTIPAGWMHPGDNTLVVRVFDTGSGGGILGDKQPMSLSCNQGTIPLSGLWKYRVGCAFNELPTAPVSPSSPRYPANLFNGMIAPLTDFPIAGVIWNQGCDNIGREKQYSALFPTLIADWRKQFHQPSLPFYFVQLANYLAPLDVQPDSKRAALREAQDAALALPKTYRLVSIDLGEEKDIHPKDKQELARRLSLLALRHTYYVNVSCSAPEYAGYHIVGNRVLFDLHYPTGAAPLLNQDHAPGFTIQSADGQWHVAQAQCINGKIEVWSDEVEFPVAARYGWADNPTCTLQTADGLHLPPFRTDK